MASLSGKTVLITGGSKGIGAATSLLLAKNGANVAINYSSDSAAAEKVVQQIGADKSIAIKGDAGNVPDIESMVDQTVKKFGKIDILIPCAGILLMRSLEQTSEADWEKTYRLNVKGPYFLSQVRIHHLRRGDHANKYDQKAVPHMPSGSHIVLISTGLTAMSTITPNYLLYVSTKGAIEQMVRVMCKDLASKGIVVNAIAPGPTATDLFLEGKSEQLLKAIANLSPFGRIGKPEEIAEGILFMASGGSQWVSGQTLRVNGGVA